MTPSLETRELTIRFGGHVAVDHVSCAFRPGELDEPLRRFIAECWSRMTRKPGSPQFSKGANGTVWLASMPLIGTYATEGRLAGGCELYRLLPVIRRPRG